MNERMKRGRVDQTYLHICSVKKNARFFKQQIEFFLISCLAAANNFSVLSLAQHIKVFFIKKE